MKGRKGRGTKWKGRAVAQPRLALDLFGPTLNKHCCVDTVAATKTGGRQTTLLSLLGDAVEDVQPAQSGARAIDIPALVRTAVQEGNLVLTGNVACLASAADQRLQDALTERFTAEPFQKTRRRQKRKQNPTQFPLYSKQAGGDLLFPKCPFVLGHLGSLGSLGNLGSLGSFVSGPASDEREVKQVKQVKQDKRYAFDGRLRPYQEKAVRHVLAHLKRLRCGCLQADPGAGKTCMMLYIASQLGLPALILVPNNKLQQQWCTEVNKWLPNAVVGVIKGKKKLPPGCTVAVCTVQTAMRRSVQHPSFATFKTVFVDETHHISAASFSKAMFAVDPEYVLGATATLQREDRLDGFIETLTGPLLYCIEAVLDAEVWPVVYHHRKFITLKDWKGDPNYAANVSQLVDHRHRTRTICKVIRKLIVEENRFPICIAKRKRLCHDVHRILSAAGVDVGCLTGDLATEQAVGKQCLVGTVGLLGEGFNDPKRDCVVLMEPLTGPERAGPGETPDGLRGGSLFIQVCGRGLRAKNQNRCLLVDFVDAGTCFESKKYGRKRWYAAKNLYTRATKVIHEPAEPSEPAKDSR